MPASLAHPRQSLKAANAALFASIEERFGVPPGPLIAIWGMETGFGTFMGNQNTLSAIATLAYDCRRPEYFTEHLYAALKLVDRGVLDTSTRGAMHGEVGQTQSGHLRCCVVGAQSRHKAAAAGLSRRAERSKRGDRPYTPHN